MLTIDFKQLFGARWENGISFFKASFQNPVLDGRRAKTRAPGKVFRLVFM